MTKYGMMSVVAAMALAGAAADFSFDLRPPSSPKRAKVSLASADASAGVLRTSALPAGKTAEDALSVGDGLTLALFDDVGIRLRLTERLESPAGMEAFLAEMSDSDGLRNAVVMQTADGLQVDVQDLTAGRVYTVVSTPEGTFVKELDPQAEPVTPSKASPPGDTIPPQARMALSSDGSADEQPSTLVDVLVAFDRNAAAYVRQDGGDLASFAMRAVAKMNLALANSGLGPEFRFRLVGTGEVDASATDVNAALYAIDGSQGGWKDVKTLREQVGADIVTTLIDTGTAYGNNGVGFSLDGGYRSRIASFASHAYNVCAVRAVEMSHTMTHEVGHNMGAGHATDMADVGNRGPQLYDYSAGYYFTGADGKKYHTIMAYDDDGYGNAFVSAPLFSSPDRQWCDAAAGDAKHDNARTIRNTYATVARWRDQKIPMSYDVFFSPESGTTFDGSITVTLTAGKSGLPIYYTLDGSTPTTSSLLYDPASPIVLTEKTTVKAMAVTDGHPGPVFEATYLLRTLGEGLDAPQLAWQTSPDYPWTFQTDDTFDGVSAVQSGVVPKGPYFDQGTESWLETTVTTERKTTMSFRFKTLFYSSDFRVTVDSAVAFKSESVSNGDYVGDWTTAEVEIPAGTHVIRFSYFQRGYYYDPTFCGVWLDDVQFDALSRPPTLSPSTTLSELTATTFSGSTQVTLVPPAGREGVLYYTLDGNDPSGPKGLAYDGQPITLTRSTLVKAVFVEPGLQPSALVQGLFLERHPVQAGEWTTDVNGVLKAAREQGGKLVAVLLANLETCGWSQDFASVAESEEFLSWARANGVYLVTADSSRHVDTAVADSYFWNLYDQASDTSGYVYYPTLFFAEPSDPTALVGEGLARADGRSQVGGVTYQGTVESLVDGFASVLGQTVPRAPVISPDSGRDVAFPLEVTLTNPNGSGTVYYTLDGSAPTRENGTAYAGKPITITSSSQVLKAAVWDADGLSSPIAVHSYETFSEWANGVFGTSGIVWKQEGSVDWTTCLEDRTIRTGGLLSRTYTSTVKATVTGKGRFAFTWKVFTCTPNNPIVYAVNGVNEVRVTDTTGTGAKTEAVMVEVNGTATFSWTYQVGDPANDYVSGYVYQGSHGEELSAWCGIWLSDVRWIPETPNGVEYAWLDAHFPHEGTLTPEQYAALENDDADGDGYKNWEEYLCGTDPNAASTGQGDGVPQCTITMDGAMPVIGHNINVPAAAQAQGWKAEVMGSTDLKTWQPADTSAHLYFKVVVGK